MSLMSLQQSMRSQPPRPQPSWRELPHVARDGIQWYPIGLIAAQLKTQPQNIRRRYAAHCRLASPAEVVSLKARSAMQQRAKACTLIHVGALNDVTRAFRKSPTMDHDREPTQSQSPASMQWFPSTQLPCRFPLPPPLHPLGMQSLSSLSPSWSPTLNPTSDPTLNPSLNPSLKPSLKPSATQLPSPRFPLSNQLEVQPGPDAANQPLPTVGPVAKAKKNHSPRNSSITVDSTLKRLHVDASTISDQNMKRIELLHRLVPRRLAHRPEKHLNILKASTNLVLTGATGKRSGTIHTRCTNMDLVKLGLFHESDVAYSGPFGKLHRMVIAAKEDSAWERAVNVHNVDSGNDGRDDDVHDDDAHDNVVRDDARDDADNARDEGENARDDARDDSDDRDSMDRMSISPPCPTESTVESEVIDAAGALLCLEQQGRPVFSREVLSPSPSELPSVEWSLDY